MSEHPPELEFETWPPPFVRTFWKISTQYSEFSRSKYSLQAAKTQNKKHNRRRGGKKETWEGKQRGRQGKGYARKFVKLCSALPLRPRETLYISDGESQSRGLGRGGERKGWHHPTAPQLSPPLLAPLEGRERRGEGKSSGARDVCQSRRISLPLCFRLRCVCIYVGELRSKWHGVLTRTHWWKKEQNSLFLIFL